MLTMMHTLKQGLQYSKKIIVNKSYLATHLKYCNIPYISTPSLALLMEQVTCEMIKDYIEIENTSVSMEINIKHLIPAKENDEIRASIHLKFIEESKLFFDFAFFNINEDLIAIGAHERIIVKKTDFIH